MVIALQGPAQEVEQPQLESSRNQHASSSGGCISKPLFTKTIDSGTKESEIGKRIFSYMMLASQAALPTLNYETKTRQRSLFSTAVSSSNKAPSYTSAT